MAIYTSKEGFIMRERASGIISMVSSVTTLIC
jgi:hypothetical protein